jgi:elongation factor Ts
MTLLFSRQFSQIPAKLVKDLRALTGSPLKDCMKVLEETKGDIEKAKDLLRKRGLADAEKRTGRVTSEGFVGMRIDRDKKMVTFIEMTCETDFVAKTDKF